ncbi:PadR family transcriptional regulator [Actinorugispora endophytica]|uniref:PadR family transcriptional regulator n=1 Tax=Actinorugispora endophytica TaxID=1605990 RepID=A0A4R6UQL5_9ACTN|nr:PadR family transcriptional regulator [Actinorugispora endophytica]TDQ48496.1 PadR family transcriptional regulator [Actinorugispora endophytica]
MNAMAMPWNWADDSRSGAGRPNEAGREQPRGPRGGRRRRWERGITHWMGMGGPHPGGFEPPRPPRPPQPPRGPWGFGPGGPMGGPPFGGPGNPYEFFFGGGRGGRGGRGSRARRGDVRTGILLLLAEGPMSGYEIIKEGRERSGGAWRPSPGSVYPMLQQLQDEGLVAPARSTGESRRRPFELTEQGRAHVAEHAAELTPPWESAAREYDSSHADYAEIASLAAQLSAAAVQVAQAGTPEQLERAKHLLAEARRGVYRILAEDDTGGVDPA